MARAYLSVWPSLASTDLAWLGNPSCSAMVSTTPAKSLSPSAVAASIVGF
jgi:hypothetical protein